jgi:hypothetical protein
MEGFRSICIIYNKSDSYNAYYLKEFFKWIGLSYVECLYNPEKNIFQNPERCAFDIFININNAMPENKEIELASSIKTKFIELNIDNSINNIKLLKQLLDTIEKQFLVGKSCQLLKRIADIYEKYHLVSIFYEYTFILLEKMGIDEYDSVYNKINLALQEIEAILQNCNTECYNGNNSTFREYVLYAKYHCQRSINELSLMKGVALEFDVKEYLNNIGEIYEYDEKFFKVEFLKAKVAEQDCSYSPTARFFLEYCVERCPVDVCKSYHYYGLAKWKEKKRQHFEASEAYRLSYYYDQRNIKTIFKIAVEKIQMNNPELAILFLQQIIDIWKDDDDFEQMPLKEIECAYKARMLMADLKSPQFQSRYKELAQRYVQFIKSLKKCKNISDNSFLKRMYSSSEQLEKICDAMLSRMDLRYME